MGCGRERLGATVGKPKEGCAAMTYTFKLARRLAVSRDYGVLTALALLAACMGDTTAPDAGSSASARTPVSLQVIPHSVIVETNQRVRFRGETRNSRGEPVATPVAWGATGGRINPDGTFSSAITGTFKVVGRGRGWRHTDTSVVVVISPATDLTRLSVTPDSARVDAGGAVAFAVTGYLADGSEAPVGVNWSATGGTVDPDGVYHADSSAGRFRVIATNASGTLADTAAVEVAAPPQPTLAEIVVRPASVSLTSGASQRFAAFGRNSAGDSVAVAVTFSATGGTISSAGLYTAGQSSGTYGVQAKAAAVTGSASVIVATVSPTPAPALTGSSLAFGSFGLFNLTTSSDPTISGLNLTQDSYTPDNVVTRIDAARAQKRKVVMAMTGGSHDNYLTDGVFDRAKWEARLQTYNTATIRKAIAGGVADGTIIGATVMDEPNVSGAGDGNTWGPPGTMTKARVDSLCADVKAMFPTLPAGVQHRWDVFEPTKPYRVCDFLTTQYSSRVGDVATWRDGALAMAKRDGHAIMFSMNILNGGTQDRDGTWDCAATGGLGTFSPNCRMTPSEVRQYGLALGPAACGGLLMWRYDDRFMADPENQQAFKDVAARLASQAAKPCRRQ